MKKKMVRYTLDTLPPLTDAQRAHLRALAGRRDTDIDTSDIPKMTDGAVEECQAWLLLSSDEAADNRTRRCRCVGLA
jgi:hypothetical protein